MGKFCCFFCPSQDYAEKALKDNCPQCGRTYEMVLEYPPTQIRQYTIKRHLGRGFYGAAFIAESGFVGKKYVVKISPKSFYDFQPFKKTPFEDEVKTHANLESSATHVVGIIDAFQENLVFSDESNSELECYVTILEYVEGELFKDFINSKQAPNVSSVCQVAIDLLQLRSELASNKLNHNDLHSENLIVERLRPESRRADAIDDKLKVMAIDLGSVSDESKSTEIRHGDLGFIAEHVSELLRRLVEHPEQLQDRDFRIAIALQGIIGNLQTGAQNLRMPDASNMVEQIREAFYRASHHWHPWRKPMSLKAFADHYNAQTMESWDVPNLLVDPDGRWLTEITRPGPQIITGMRGCGKTMLLRALDIHARASAKEGDSSNDIIQRLRDDKFIGLFVSAQRLLELKKGSSQKVQHRLMRLFIAYALQAVRALMHLRDVDPSAILPGAAKKIGEAVEGYLIGSSDLSNSITLDDLESKLQKITVLSVNKVNLYSVDEDPSAIFNHLAEKLKECSEVFSSSSVFFLLDDVSTRYLELDNIEAILSKLLFQSPTCAFKFTSEWQTIELGLRSPGRNHPIRVGRDLTVFDLGEDVFKTINARGSGGKNFVAKILQQRADLHAQHPTEKDPRKILGDVPLEQVAREIASTPETGSKKKRIYRGLSCLTSVCVGDIGDVIKLYEEILRRAPSGGGYPIDDSIQSACFQEMSARRLYDLNRRTTFSKNLKNHALAFAQTAHELLVRSQKLGKNDNQEKIRLRQYSSIYVRVTAEDEENQKLQIDKLRELIDAGVFVFAGGSPRAKTKDSDPILQFILSYRKIYGLASYIGLSDRDRFELSGNDLSDWLDLNDVKEAKEVLLRNQINDEVNSNGLLDNFSEVEDTIQKLTSENEESTQDQMRQADLFAVFNVADDKNQQRLLAEKAPVSVNLVNQKYIEQLPIKKVLLGLGFEERTLASSKLLSEATHPISVEAIKYPLEGFSKQIKEHWQLEETEYSETEYSDFLNSDFDINELLMIDITGLAKPLMFKAVKTALQKYGRVIVCHTSALSHYPLTEDLNNLFETKNSDNPIEFLDNLSRLLKGEDGPYNEVSLYKEDVDNTRNRALIAFASSKHERLFSLLDNRDYDQVELITTTGDQPHSRVSRYTAEFICQNYANANVSDFSNDELSSLVDYLDSRYLELYGLGGANFEIGLTGTKTQALAASIISSVRKVSQALYLSPQKFDENKFSKGVGKTRFYDIKASHYDKK